MNRPPTDIRRDDSPSDVWDALAEGAGVAVVADGDARALVVEVAPDEVDEAMVLARALRARLALARIQAESVRNGTHTMTLEEINAEIAAYRAERRAASA